MYHLPYTIQAASLNIAWKNSPKLWQMEKDQARKGHEIAAGTKGPDGKYF